MAWYLNLEQVLVQWEQMGIFNIVLPFLLIFALVYGILQATKFPSSKGGIHLLIALAIALIALRWANFVSDFLSEIFPRLGVGLAVILTLYILVGMFIAQEQQRYWGYGLASVGALIALIIIWQSFDNLGWISSGGPASDMSGLIFFGLLIVGVIIAISTSSTTSHTPDPNRGRATFPASFRD